MNKLYPLKFSPILKETIWGGTRLEQKLNKNTLGNHNIGESWEISAVPGNLSIVTNGALKGFNIEELLATYKEQLVGEKIYNKFGNTFPLLIKFIDANDNLSIQVHPDDELAKKRHNSFGKTEMWYIIDNDENAKLISGFNQKMDRDKYIECMRNGTIKEVLNAEDVSPDDVFYLPAGRVHAIGSGILLAEIQQTSNITYRIYDWDRKDKKGNRRELHTELAVDAIDYNYVSELKSKYNKVKNETCNIVESSFFNTNVIEFDKELSKDYSNIDSFVIYMAIEGDVSINYEANDFTLNKGETILIPSCSKELKLIPATSNAKILEVFIN